MAEAEAAATAVAAGEASARLPNLARVVVVMEDVEEEEEEVEEEEEEEGADEDGRPCRCASAS